MFTVMSTCTQPSETGTVPRCQKDGTRLSVECPESVIAYNRFMGGVDRGDQLRGYYSCRMKSRKFYKYIFHFLFDTSITNAYILGKRFGSGMGDTTVKEFHMQLAQELIGNYCSRRRAGRGGGRIRPLFFFLSNKDLQQREGEDDVYIVVSTVANAVTFRGTALHVKCGFVMVAITTLTVTMCGTKIEYDKKIDQYHSSLSMTLCEIEIIISTSVSNKLHVFLPLSLTHTLCVCYSLSPLSQRTHIKLTLQAC